MADPTNYGAALAELRAFTKSDPGRGPYSILLRAVAVSRVAAASVARLPLRTKAERRAAIVAAAEAIRAADERKAAGLDAEALNG